MVSTAKYTLLGSLTWTHITSFVRLQAAMGLNQAKNSITRASIILLTSSAISLIQVKNTLRSKGTWAS